MKTPEFPPDELERLRALHALGILDTPTEERFDRITRIAKYVLGVPIVAISLIDRDRQWFKSIQGLDVKETPRDISFCGHAVASGHTLLIPDATRDDRFHDNPLVLNDPSIRAYAGQPLVTSDGACIGTLCAIDRRTRDWTADEIRVLKDLAVLVENELATWTSEVRGNEEDGTSRSDELSREVERRHRIERMLLETSLLQKAVLDGANYSIVSTTPDGIITTFNAAAERMLGYSAKEVVGRLSPAVIHLGDEVVARARALTMELGETVEPGFEAFIAKARQGHVDENEWTYVRKDGSYFPVRLSITALRDPGGEITGYLGIAQDITERRQYEIMLKEAKEEAEAATRAKSEFLANMSHELRTPLNSVIGFANVLLKNRGGNLTEQDRNYIGRIFDNGKHLLGLINTILDLSKVEAGRMELHPETVELERLVGEIMAHFEIQAQGRPVTLEFEPPVRVRPILADIVKLRQVLTNLVGNALKFTERGSIRVEIEVDAEDRPRTIRVTDTGIGIAKDKLETIFEAFQQAESSTARRFGGTGLGLTITRSLCELMGYELRVESREGIGSVFTIRIPPPAYDSRFEPPSTGEIA